MKKKKKLIIIIVSVVLLVCLGVGATILLVKKDEQEKKNKPYTHIGIGGGGAFFNPMVDPEDSDVCYVTSDMGALYYTKNKGKTWNRTESKGVLSFGCVADDGTLFVGGYGLYASYDKGESIKLIYPKNVKLSVSRCGWNENLMLADGYDNGYLRCVSTSGDRVYFTTVDWEGNLKVLECDFLGDNLKTLYTLKLAVSDPHDVDVYMVKVDNGLYFSIDNSIYFYDKNANVSVIYIAKGEIKDLEKIGEYIFIIDDKADRSEILYTKDFVTFEDLMVYNELGRNFVQWNTPCTFNWHFKQITGNNFNNIFLSFSSPVNEVVDTVHGILKFNGEEFEWVFDSMFKTRNTLDKEDWSYGCHGPFYGISASKSDDNMCLVANIESVYIVSYENASRRSVYTTHCNVHKKDGQTTYSTNGLDVQTTYSVKTDPFNYNHIIICTTDLGLQNSYDGGKTFRRMELAYLEQDIYNTCYDVYFDRFKEGYVFGLWSSRHDAPYNPTLSDKDVTKGAFALSCDGGKTWDMTYSQGIPSDAIPVKMSVIEGQRAHTFIVATFNRGFFISRDNGRNFEPINYNVESFGGLIFGEDVVIHNNKAYLLTAPYLDGGNWRKARLYEYEIRSGDIIEIDMGDIVLARSLTVHEEKGVYINVIPTYHYEWFNELNDGFWVNDNGGIYHLNNGSVEIVFENKDGIFNSGFNIDGTMYAVDTYGKVFVEKNGKFELLLDGLFNMLKNVSFSRDGKVLYVTTFGGGVYRIELEKVLNK